MNETLMASQLAQLQQELDEFRNYAREQHTESQRVLLSLNARFPVLERQVSDLADRLRSLERSQVIPTPAADAPPSRRAPSGLAGSSPAALPPGNPDPSAPGDPALRQEIAGLRDQLRLQHAALLAPLRRIEGRLPGVIEQVRRLESLLDGLLLERAAVPWTPRPPAAPPADTGPAAHTPGG